MRKTAVILCLFGLVFSAMPAFGELQNVTVGGSVRIRGNYISNTFTNALAPEMRWPAGALAQRPIGGPFNPNVMSLFDWDSRGSDLKFVEQRTRLNAKAQFSDNVSAFIELDSYDTWGQDFRSNYITGVDAQANSVDDVEVYQAYIQADQMGGYPVSLRIGRQELAFGSQWLVGPRDFAFFFSGLSFDAVRLTWNPMEELTLDAWWSKLAENSPMEEDSDVDFYGIYGTYKGFEDITLDAYWLFIRDARMLEDVPGGPIWEWAEEVWGVDDYDPTGLHTIGARGAGKIGAFDFDAEVAYQFGQADQIGFTFKPALYGDDGADFGEWGGRLELGYSFDYTCHPRVFIGGMYLGGEDNRDISFWEWLNPFDKPEASVSFNRLFSNHIYSGSFDLWNDLSNAYLVRAGVTGSFTDKLSALFCVTYVETLDAFDAPVHFRFGRWRVPILPALSWWTDENDSDLGIETDVFLTYRYSQDLLFEIGWAHFFTGDGSEEGNFSRWNGLLFNGGTDDDDADYVYIGSTLNF